ncbi:heterokaryon incompatibility protein-domain-containing protein [Echria macrotheca]|uniref:Heterokaryon incompatibility protein-domain-containing protein n=1 Tax=Echria macrotheca TaxID=438768 RepID=A0AAJ0BIU3_9PEZI|nr:heterokaryon incompatibility protein-domain-containing protein [Echria macrotheca]
MASDQDPSDPQLPDSFEYSSLPDDGSSVCIRLLELLPGKGGEEIRIKLSPVSLSQEIKYEALSYCWGSAKTTGFILCNGKSFAVTANLMGALEMLRQEDSTSRLWIDAVCINQGSISERNQQVAVMRDIYSNANQTIVWLGPEADGSEIALGIIPDLLAVRDKFGGGWGNSEAPIEINTRYLEAPEEIDSAPGVRQLIQNTQARTAFLALLGRPWFTRVWIIQEVVVSHHATVVCGSVRLPFDDLVQAAWVFDSLGLQTNIGLRRLLEPLWDIWDTRRKYDDWWPNTMFQLLLRHRWCLATDPRDKVYALCGIANDAKTESQRNSEQLPPDWRQVVESQPLPTLVNNPDYGLTIVDVYTKLAANLLTSPNVGLDLFSAIHPSIPRIDGLPSWAPDWSVTDRFYNFRVSSKNFFYDAERRRPFESDPTSSIQPHEGGYSVRGGSVGSARDIWLSKAVAWRSEYLRSFQACRESHSDIRVSDPPQTITLSGMIVDVIDTVGQPSVSAGSRPYEFLMRVAEWSAIARDARLRVVAANEAAALAGIKDGEHMAIPAAPYLLSADHQSAIRAWVLTMMGGHVYVETEIHAHVGFNMLHRAMELSQEIVFYKTMLEIAELRASGGLATLNAPESSIKEWEAYDAETAGTLLAEAEAKLAGLRSNRYWILVERAKEALGVGMHTRFVVGKKGYYALVPAAAIEGDEIVVFRGGCMPIVVRDRRQIVGDCYVHGIMEGEVWKEELCREFVIS